jgi:uncharacterized membrane protein
VSPFPATERPRISLEFTTFEKSGEVLSVALIVLHIGLLVSRYSSLPDIIPIHFNLEGQPDGWGGKWATVVILIISIVLYASMTLISRYPHLFNYPVKVTAENAERQYQLARTLVVWMKTQVILLFFLIQWSILETARGASTNLSPMVLPLVLCILLSVVVYFVRAIREA